MKILKQILPFVLITTILLVNLLVFYRITLSHPNSTHLNNSGDAFKNYFTPTYHAKYDSGYWWFEGMNYPYGEHVVFADAQPLISNSIKFISNNIIDISGQTQGILNLLMLLSFFPGAVFLYLLFRKLKVPPVPGAVFAALIMLLSPQVLRFPGHNALAYTCYVPMLLWGLWMAWEKRTWAWSAGVGGFILLWGFIQPYYIMLGALMTASVWAMTLLMRWKQEVKWKLFLHFFIMALLPLVIFKGFLSITDPITDRPDVPFGFFEYHAYWESVFLPVDFPHIKLFHALSNLVTGGPVRGVSWEGKAYVGMAAAFVFVFFFVRFLFQLGRGVIKKDWKYILRPSPNRQMNIFIYASILILLFSCTFPFVWKFKVLVQYIPYLNQFRSIGRFAWLFYYIWTVFTCYFLWLNFRNWRMKAGWKRVLGYAVIGLTMVMYGYEGYYWNHHVTHDRMKQERYPEMEALANEVPELKWLEEVQSNEYGAIMVLPYFHEGSENLNFRSLKSVGPAFQASLRTGLPLTNVMMSRSSLSQTLAQTEMQKEEYRPLRILETWDSEKPLLTFFIKNTNKPMIEDVTWFAPKIYDDENVWVKRLSRQHLDTLGTGTNWKIAGYLQQIAAADTVYSLDNGFFKTEDDPTVFRNSLDDEQADFHYRGAGGGQEKATDNKYLWRGPVEGVQAGDKLTFSAWLYVGEEGHPKHYFGTELHARGDFGEPRFWNYNSSNEYIVAMDGPWALVEKEIEVEVPTDSLTVNFTQWSRRPKYVYVDEFLMRRSGTHVFGLVEGEFFWDGRFYPVEPGFSLPMGN